MVSFDYGIMAIPILRWDYLFIEVIFSYASLIVLIRVRNGTNNLGELFFDNPNDH